MKYTEAVLLRSPGSFPMMPLGVDALPRCDRKQQKKKKSVVFADSQGLTLTDVHVFRNHDHLQTSRNHEHLQTSRNHEHLQTSRNHDHLQTFRNHEHLQTSRNHDHLQTSRNHEDLQTSRNHDHLQTSRNHEHLQVQPMEDQGGLVLDFVEPAADYLDLRNRLTTQQVCLETCWVHQGLLSGTVQVQNLCFTKSVSVRITFDSWSSFEDFPCSYLENLYGCPGTDTFSFSVPTAEPRVRPCSRAEFCIKYQIQDRTFWDNNRGSNYVLVAPEAGREPGAPLGCDPFGSPRTSVGVFPEWQSCGLMEDSAPCW